MGRDRPPDYMEWVLGWRQFRFSSNGYASAIAHDFVWSPGENKAECEVDHKGIIHDGHHCGFNAYFDAVYVSDPCALIRGRGDRFSLHPEGFRSEYAEILCFIGSPANKVLEKASEIYGVPIFGTKQNAEEWAKAEGLGDFFPEDRRPCRLTIPDPVHYRSRSEGPHPVETCECNKCRTVRWEEKVEEEWMDESTEGKLSWGLAIVVNILLWAAIAGFVISAITT